MKSTLETVRKCHTALAQLNTAVTNLMNKFKKINTVLDVKKNFYHNNGCSLGKVATGKKKVAETPKITMSHELQPTLPNILTKKTSF